MIIGIDRSTLRLGYLLAYLIPMSAFVGGALIGSIMGELLVIPSLDVLMAFSLLSLSAVLSFRKLRELDKTHHMEIKRIISDGKFTEFVMTEEERHYLSCSSQC